jgi:uncharacterized damage-inducible protein DinB
MTETTTLRTLLLPELEHEFAKTRKMLERVPDGQNAFKPHHKSMPLSHLAGHVAELPEFITTVLTSPNVDMSTMSFTPYRMETMQQALAQFDQLADTTITTVKNMSDEAFQQNWILSWKGHELFNGNRYTAYREMGVNHLIHHRAQLSVYLRELGVAIPGCYGPSADEMP